MHAQGTQVHRVRMHTSGMLAAFGLALNLVWCTLMGHTLGFISSASYLDPWVNSRLFFLAGILVVSLAYVAAPRLLKHADGGLRFTLPLIGAFGTACFGMSYHQTFFDPMILAVGGLFVSGGCYLWLVARYNLMLARTHGFKSSVASIAGGLIIKLPLLLIITSFVGPELQVVIAIAMPLVSAFVFEASCAAARAEATAEEEDLVEVDTPINLQTSDTKVRTHTVFGVPARLRNEKKPAQAKRRTTFVLLAVAAAVLAVIRSVSYLGAWGDTNAVVSTEFAWLTSVVLPALCVIVFAYVALVRMADYSLATRFQPALLIILVGLLVVAVQASPDGASLSFLTTIIQIDELFAHLLFWVVVITALDVLDTPSYRVIGIAGALYAGTSIAWVLLLSKAPITTTLLMMLITYGLVIGALYVISALSREKGAERSPETTEPETQLSRSIMDTCQDMAERYSLSPRETEVFTLLAQGRTRAFIQEELVLSGSTVKTHVSHIYAKMDVHDRQEMMDLIWS